MNDSIMRFAAPWFLLIGLYAFVATHLADTMTLLQALVRLIQASSGGM